MFPRSLTRRSSLPHRRRGIFEQLERRFALSVAAIEPISTLDITGNTADKPQSKVWEYGGYWWSVVSRGDGSYVHRLDGDQWTSVLKVTGDKFARADVKPVDNVAHVLIRTASSFRLASIEYVAGDLPTYKAWSRRSSVVKIPDSAETGTIDIDSQGRMWLAHDNINNIEVRYSDAPYRTWSEPIVLASNVNDDDICTVTAFPNGNVGVLWSNQNTQRFGFRLHVAGTAPAEWTKDEVPAAQSALNVGMGMADDHLHAIVAPNGTLYAAVKTSYDTAGRTAIGLLVRRTTGDWDAMYQVDTLGTRPIVALSPTTNKLLVMYSQGGISGGVYREADATSMVFGSRMPLFNEAAANDLSSSKQYFSDDLIVVGSTTNVLLGRRVLLNQPPLVNAGADQTAVANQPLQLNGSVADDGYPASPGAVSTTWIFVSGPGTAVFENRRLPATTATFDAPGSYVLRLTADDGEYRRTDQVTITVLGAPPSQAMFQEGVSPDDSYRGTIDAMINFNLPDDNKGAAASLQVDGSPDLAALIRWDLSAVPVGSTLQEASLTIFVTDTSPHIYHIYEAKRAWVESQVTWNQYAAGLQWESAGAQGTSDRGSTSLGTISSTASGTVSIALNSFGVGVVQRWIDNPAENFGFVIQEYTQSTDGLTFASSEAATLSKRPALNLTYSAPASQTAASSSAASMLASPEPTATRSTSPVAPRQATTTHTTGLTHVTPAHEHVQRSRQTVRPAAALAQTLPTDIDDDLLTALLEARRSTGG